MNDPPVRPGHRGLARLLSGAVFALILTAASAAMMSGVARAATQICSNQTGTNGGMYYQMYTAGTGSACITLNSPSSYSTTWSGIGDFVAGVGWNPGNTSAKSFTSSLSASGGTSLVSLYGWSTSPLVEYYVMEDYAGSPPTAAELMRRHSFKGGSDALNLLLVEWERWSAELLESHISYPLLCYFRSQHTNQSWLSALTSVLDVCALMIAGVQDHAARQAQLTFAIARHAMVDIAQIFSQAPVKDGIDRLPPERFEELYALLCSAGIRVCRDDGSMERLRKMRALYEGYAEALSRFLCMPLPPWIADQPHKDNWLSVAKLREQAESVGPESVNLETALPIALHEDEHHF